MDQPLTVALDAHDDDKEDLLDWASHNRDTLARFRLVSTGTTGALLSEALDLPVDQMALEPDSGDQQIGARVMDGRIDMLIYFCDPLTARGHAAEAKALLRTAVLRDIPNASTRSTADRLISSHHLLFANPPGTRRRRIGA